jgi:hypothetical protein
LGAQTVKLDPPLETGIEMLRIHRFTTADLEQAARLYVTCFNAPPWDDDWSSGSATRRLETLLKLPGAMGLVAFRKTEMVGLTVNLVTALFPSTALAR